MPGAEVTERLIEDENDLVLTLKRDFALDVPEAASLWPKIMARHDLVMQEKAPGLADARTRHQGLGSNA